MTLVRLSLDPTQGEAVKELALTAAADHVAAFEPTAYGLHRLNRKVAPLGQLIREIDDGTDVGVPRVELVWNLVVNEETDGELSPLMEGVLDAVRRVEEQVAHGAEWED